MRYSAHVFRVMREATSTVRLAGITCIRKVRNAREGLKWFVANGGKVEVAIMDPTSEAFRLRRAEESDGDHEGLKEIGLITLRMDFEAHVVVELLKGLKAYALKMRSRGDVALRTYAIHPPPASIAIVDRRLAHRYPYRPKHEGDRGPALISWDGGAASFHEIEDESTRLWEHASSKDVNLDDLAPRASGLPLDVAAMLEHPGRAGADTAS